MSAKVNLSGFHRSIMLMRQLPRKHGPDILNKSVVKVAIGSGGEKGIVHLTKKATKARIEADLRKGKLGIRLAMAWLKKQGQPRTPEAVSKAYERIRSARVKGKSYIAASWLFAVAQIARVTPGLSLSRVRGRGTQQWGGGTAAQSFGRAATANALRAGLFSTAEGAELISNSAVIQMAVDGATADNLVYLRRKWGAGMNDAIAGTFTAEKVQ